MSLKKNILKKSLETTKIVYKKVRYIVKNIEQRYHEWGDEIEFTGHPEENCKYGCKECELGDDNLDTDDEEICKVQVVFIGTEEYYKNLKKNELYLIPKYPNSRNARKQIIVGYSKINNEYEQNRHFLNPAQKKLTRNRETRYVVNELKYKHPNGSCIYGCGNCNPVSDDDDSDEEHEVLVDVIKINGKDYFVDIYTKEIHKIEEIEENTWKTNHRYKNKQIIVGIAKTIDGPYTFF